MVAVGFPRCQASLTYAPSPSVGPDTSRCVHGTAVRHVPRAPSSSVAVMYSDNRPCQVCGSPVELRPHSRLVVNEPDDTVDDRVCTNADCPTNKGGEGTDAPRP